MLHVAPCNQVEQGSMNADHLICRPLPKRRKLPNVGMLGETAADKTCTSQCDELQL